MKNDVIKILIADDHDLIRQGLKTIIGLEDDLKVECEAKNGEEVLNLLEKYDAHVLILDINMPHLSGIDVLRQLRNSKSNIKIILLTIEDDGNIIHEAINMGADGYLLKDSAGSEIVEAVRLVYKGEKYIDKALVNTLFKDVIKKNKQENRLSILSKRELEVLINISKGFSNKEIGLLMYLSEKSIKNYATNIFKKLNVHDRVQAAYIAYENSINDYYKDKYKDRD